MSSPQTIKGASVLPESPLQASEVCLEPCACSTSTLGVRLVTPSAGDIVPRRMPAVVLASRPLDIELISVGSCTGAQARATVACCLSTHAILTVSFETHERDLAIERVPISVRPSGDGWIARALICPTSWAAATSVTVASLTFGGKALPCYCFPHTMRVGYNHAPVPAGAVYAAADAGDVPALQAALDAGGSTEEADNVGGR